MRPRRPRARADEFSDEELAWLRGEPEAERSLWFFSEATPEKLEALWREHGAEIVAEHILDDPGTRPQRWWTYDAPEPRLRLGGIGTACHERLANLCRLDRGVPVDWIFSDLVATYEKMGLSLGVPAVDPSDPPRYESQAAYLDRINLLTPGERRQLRKADFEPETAVDDART